MRWWSICGPATSSERIDLTQTMGSLRYSYIIRSLFAYFIWCMYVCMYVCTKVLLRLLQYISLVLYVCVNKNVDIKYMSVCMYVCMYGRCLRSGSGNTST